MTSFLDRLFGRPEPPKTPYAKAVTDLGPWSTGIPLSSLATTPQDKAAAYLRAYKVGWFYKAGAKIARDVSRLDWSLALGDAEEGDVESELDRPDVSIPFERLNPVDQLQRLLEVPYRVNGRVALTGEQLLHKTEVHLDFTGNACWYMVGAPGRPTGLLPISPARMTPSRNKRGDLIGWVMDADQPTSVPFSVEEILWFSTGGPDDDVWGTSVVESVYSQVPLTDMMARHTGTVLSTGGRLAGMLWPKDRALTEDEFVDAQRAWRNVASDPEAGKRLLVFPEPMEYAQGASTPQEIGIPELAVLNRDEILTAFPISPYRLGVPQPGGLNSGEVRREDRIDYWQETIDPRGDLISSVIQVGLVPLYEAAMGQTYRFKLMIPQLDDAPSLMEKTAAYKGLVSIGLDPKQSLSAVGLDHIKWLGLPELLDPAKQAEAAAAAQEAKLGDGQRTTVRDNTPRDNTATQQTIVGKETKSHEEVADAHRGNISAFLDQQRERIVTAVRSSMPASKAARSAAMKVDPEWWDAAAENAALRETLRVLYTDAGRQSLQVVADNLNRIVPNKAVDRIVTDLLAYGGERIADINARTLQAITLELAEGTRRGYSIAQLIDGVPDEGFKGVLNVGMDNGVGVWGDARAETIARTETALSYNRAALGGYREFRVQRVLAYDGDGDPECAARNGHEFSVDDAFSIADHPNGTLDWAPVVDKAYHEPQPLTVAPVVNVTLPHITVEPADVSVTVPEQPVTVNLPEPIVNVKAEAPVVNVRNDVQTPNVTVEVETPSVTVHNDVKPTKAVEPVINVTVQPDLRIVSMPDRVTKRRVERDKQGRITDTTDVETDG